MSLSVQRGLARDRLTDAIAALRKALTNARADLATAEKALVGLGAGSEPHALMAAVAAAQRLFDAGVAANMAGTEMAGAVDVLEVLRAAGHEELVA